MPKSKDTEFKPVDTSKEDGLKKPDAPITEGQSFRMIQDLLTVVERLAIAVERMDSRVHHDEIQKYLK